MRCVTERSLLMRRLPSAANERRKPTVPVGSLTVSYPRRPSLASPPPFARPALPSAPVCAPSPRLPLVSFALPLLVSRPFHSQPPLSFLLPRALSRPWPSRAPPSS